jgi:hypothetical protein
VSFATITLCVASQRVFIIIVVCVFMTQSGNFWIHHRIYLTSSHDDDSKKKKTYGTRFENWGYEMSFELSDLDEVLRRNPSQCEIGFRTVYKHRG